MTHIRHHIVSMNRWNAKTIYLLAGSSMKLVLITFIFLYFLSSIQANERIIIDSLQHSLQTITDDSVIVITHLKLFDSYDYYSSDTSKHHLSIATDLAKSLNIPFLTANVHSRWASVLTNEGLLDSALVFHNKSLPYFKEHIDYSDPFSVSYLYSQYYGISAIYYSTSEYDKALEFNFKCIELLQKQVTKDPDWNDNLAKLYHFRAIIFFTTELFDEAKLYLKRGVELAEDPLIISHLARLQAVIYENEDNQDSTEIVLQSVLKTCKDSENSSVCNIAHHQLGSFYRQHEQFEKSTYHFKEGLRYAKLLNSIHAITNSYQGLANLETQMGRYKEASQSYHNLSQMYDEYPTLNIAGNFYKTWGQVEDTLGNYKLASSLFYKYIMNQDSTLSKEKTNVIAEIETKYKLAEKNNELIQAELNIRNKENQRNLLFGGTGFLALLGFYFWNRSRLNRKIYLQENRLRLQQKKEIETKTTLLSMSSMLEGQESERKRIAQDLHDGLGGLLATIKMKFNIIQNQIEELESIDVYQQTSSMIDNACSEVRKIAHNMMPDSLSKLGLIEAVRDMADYTSDITVKLINLGKHQLTENQEIMLYRVIQEFLYNTRKHAEATQLIIQFSSDEHNTMIYLEDDGIGFDTSDTSLKKGLGLTGMQSRVNFIGGSFKLESTIGLGTTVQIKIPK